MALPSKVAATPEMTDFHRLADALMRLQSAMERMGLLASQTLATLFDGITRHNPEGLWFRRQAQAYGFKSAVEWRDSGRPIPEGETARQAIEELDAFIAMKNSGYP